MTAKILRTPIAKVNPPAEGTAVPFEGKLGMQPVEGIVLCRDGKYRAFENECRHIPLPLDDPRSGKFLDKSGHLVCQHHGALYEILTGVCVDGPCVGDKLRRFSLELIAGALIIYDEEALENE